MKSTWSIVEKSNGELLVTVDGEQWKTAQEKAFKKLAGKLNVKGFRQGKAPVNIARKMIGQNEIMMNAIDAVAQEALVFGVEEQGLELIDRPSLDLNSFTTEAVELKFLCTVEPEVTLGTYKGVEYDEIKVRVNAGEVKDRLEQIRNNAAEMVLKEEGTVEKGDTANIDFEGFKDDIAFEGGKGEGYDLEIGSNTFIPGFEDQLIGMTAGEEKDINVTFPEDYQAEDLAGQPVVFKVKVNEIKTKSVPELTDELVKELKLYDAETVKDLEKSVKNEIRTRKQKDAESKMNDQILGAVVDGATVEIPEVMIEDETNSMLEDIKNRLAQQGLEMDFYLQMMGKTEQDLRDDYKEEAEKRVKTRLVLKAVAKAEGIEVSAEELEDEFKALADQYQMEVAQIKQYISGTTLGNDVRMRKAVDLVKTAATKKEKDA